MRIPFILAACLALSGCVVPVVIPVTGGGVTASTASRERAVVAPSDAGFDASYAAFRRSQGLPVATPNAALTRAAQAHAADMAAQNYFDHVSKDGRTFIQRLAEQGYHSCHPAENLAWGQENASAALNEWIASPGHLRNLRLSGEVEYGLGQVGGIYVLMVARLC